MSKKEIKSVDLARKVAQIFADRKGFDISILDVREISSMTDLYLIVSGNSSPHLKALYDETQKELKKDGLLCYRKAGDPQGGWLILDYLNIVIHIFSKEAREYYAIEELWETAPRIDPLTQ